jgi:hypothetical protein
MIIFREENVSTAEVCDIKLWKRLGNRLEVKESF